MFSHFAFAFFAIFYPSRYFFIAMLCLFLTFCMSTSPKAYHPNDLLQKIVRIVSRGPSDRTQILGIPNRTKFFCLIFGWDFCIRLYIFLRFGKS